MEMEKPTIQTFDDLSECTEYYYDEFGKLNSVKEIGYLKKKEVKKLHKFLISSFFDTMENLGKKSVVANKMDKIETKETKKEFKKEHEVGVVRKVIAPLKSIGCGIKSALGAAVRLITKKPKVDVLPPDMQIEGGGNSSFSALPKGENVKEDVQNNEEMEGEENPQSEEETD